MFNFLKKPKNDREEQQFYEEAINNSLRVTSQEDELLMKIIEESKQIKNQEDVELQRALEASRDDAEKKGIIKKKRPIKNVNKIIMYDFGEIDKIDTIDLILKKRKHQIDIDVSLIEDNIQKWKVTFDTGRYLWGKMSWEVVFTDDFPKKAPKIRVMTPVFKPYTGHITIGGAICNPILVTGLGWSSKTEMLTVIISLIDAMVNSDSPAKLNDGDDRVRPYTAAEAEDGRKRFLQAHGWTY